MRRRVKHPQCLPRLAAGSVPQPSLSWRRARTSAVENRHRNRVHDELRHTSPQLKRPAVAMYNWRCPGSLSGTHHEGIKANTRLNSLRSAPSGSHTRHTVAYEAYAPLLGPGRAWPGAPRRPKMAPRSGGHLPTPLAPTNAAQLRIPMAA